jgi:hypothetical protein
MFTVMLTCMTTKIGATGGANDGANDGKRSSRLTAHRVAAHRVTAHRVRTPWGPAEVVEEARVAQRVGEKRFAATVQLLAGADDQPYVRVSYTTDGIARRGPVTLKVRELERLLAAVREQPGLAAAFRMGGDS